nr:MULTISPECIES: nucleotidyltransferase domain-containing protein [unclassified Clostridium]
MRQAVNRTIVIKTIEILKKEFNPTIIYLFVSAAKNNLREDSDIDIAFLSENSTDEYKCFMVSQELADIFKREVDLNLSSTVFKVQVIGNGKVIYCIDNTKRIYFEMESFKEYAILNEEREVVINKMREEIDKYGQ